jgi:hypothetical protein
MKADQQKYLKHLCDHRPLYAKDTLRSLLYRKGGLYRDIPQDTNASSRYDDITRELNRTQQLVISAIAEIQKLHLLVYDKISKDQRAETS